MSRISSIKIILLLSAFIALSFSELAAKSEARIKFSIGFAQVMPNKKTAWTNIRPDMSIYQGDRLRTTLNSRIELEMPDGTIIKINENTTFDVKEIKTVEEDNEDKMSFTLWAGNIWAQFKKIVGGRQKREIESPSAVVAVRGTILDMNVDMNKTTRVRVMEGRVAVTAKGVAGEVMVGSNQETIVERGKKPTPPRSFSTQGDDKETDEDFAVQINTTKLQFTDPSILLAGIPISGKVPAGVLLTANGKPLNVAANGNFSGKIQVHEGLNEILFRAEKGRKHKTKTMRVYVNTKRPEIRLSRPITSRYTNRRDYSLSGAVFDATPRDKVKVYINDEMVAEIAGRGSFNRTIILKEGKNNIRLRAVDRSKNTMEIVEQMILDTVNPRITVTEPAQQILTRFEPPRPPDNNINLAAIRYKQKIRGIVIDPEPSSGIKRVVINGKEIKPHSDGSFEVTINLATGSNRLSFLAEDLAGNIFRDNSRMINVR